MGREPPSCRPGQPRRRGSRLDCGEARGLYSCGPALHSAQHLAKAAGRPAPGAYHTDSQRTVDTGRRLLYLWRVLAGLRCNRPVQPRRDRLGELLDRSLSHLVHHRLIQPLAKAPKRWHLPAADGEPGHSFLHRCDLDPPSHDREEVLEKRRLPGHGDHRPCRRLHGLPKLDYHALTDRNPADMDSDRAHAALAQAREPLMRSVEKSFRTYRHRSIDVNGMPDEHDSRFTLPLDE